MSVLIGCPAETEPRENRVALTPDVAARLHRAGLDVIVGSGAGRGRGSTMRSTSRPARASGPGKRSTRKRTSWW